ncbi:hypothetical protein EV360DRAFT_81642 [Lentinula raphanica]|nr:hypothetical protein EV360DRAFT_81642 [Lentinula raphanica]
MPTEGEVSSITTVFGFSESRIAVQSRRVGSGKAPRKQLASKAARKTAVAAMSQAVEETSDSDAEDTRPTKRAKGSASSAPFVSTSTSTTSSPTTLTIAQRTAIARSSIATIRRPVPQHEGLCDDFGVGLDGRESER